MTSSYKTKFTENDKLWYKLVVEPTHLKNMLVKLDHFPKDRDENSNVKTFSMDFPWA